MKINVLPSEIYNKISAGEVVERPASVVKELVENSIDGGATKITVEVFDGGIKKIVVTDNGCGIEPEDIESAFLPHATSKIKDAKDLETISSLGFRGEALASIASVSRVELISKTENNEFGMNLKIEGGKYGNKKEIGFDNGTKIIVSDLFFNTPARLKFLKKPKSEEGEITNLMAKFILANPQISFQYIVDDKIIYNTFGNGLAEAMYIIYGKEVYDNLLEVKYDSNDISVYGFIARPTLCKANRTYQTIFVNGRVVSNYMISSAVQDAVENYIMKGKFPLFALNINLPFESVDVNVHPSKQEVKFENPNRIYGIVNTAIFKAVSEANYVQDKTAEIQKENSVREPVFDTKSLLETIMNGQKEKNCFKSEYSPLVDILNEKIKENNEKSKVEISQIKLEEVIVPANDTKVESLNRKIVENKNKILFEDYHIIGVLFNTYILCEKGDSLLIIDQHAGHERQLYDKFTKQIKGNNLACQDLLFPYVFNTNLKETEFLENNLELFREYGIDISEFGENSFKISAVPVLLSEINLKDFFENILSDINEVQKKSVDFFKEKIAKQACRSAIKAGDKLSDSEINFLLDSFKENGNVLLCPHGRPIVLQFSKTEIEKWFKRIV
ncbi:MAG: DNA mismatch repair endonuclease MutL [Christensenellales bacterium]